MSQFNGITKQVFDSCQKSEKIRIPIAMLKDLRAVVEPELRKINPTITGHVSRVKDRGTNNYRNWAWLYFNTQPKEPYRYSQLAVNISPKRFYVGVDVRTPSEYRTFKKEIVKEANNALFENLAKVLSRRQLFFSDVNDPWEQEPLYYSVEELKGQLLSPSLSWINIPFEKDDPKLNDKHIADEVVEIFKDLYNILALASDNKPYFNETIGKPSFVNSIFIDTVDSKVDAAQSDQREITVFLNSLHTSTQQTNHKLPSKNNQILVKTKAISYDLKPIKAFINDQPITVYSDYELKEPSKALKNYRAFENLLNEISALFPLPNGFLKIMYVNPATDARYSKQQDVSIFANLAVFDIHSDRFFWLFTIVRELAYVHKHQIGYPFIKDMRKLLVYALRKQAQSFSN